MPTVYTYELWNGKEVVGHYCSSTRLIGLHVVIPYVTALKSAYGRRIKTVIVPVMHRVLPSSGVDYCVRPVLDVRRKSARQIKIILEASRAI